MNKRFRRTLLCLGVGALAPWGLGAAGFPAYVVEAFCVAVALWVVCDILDHP